jgi:flagellar motility protein MotE (MotC chaperone)
MTLRISTPRLLPITIVAIVALLGLKTSHLVRAANPPGASPAPAIAVPQQAAPVSVPAFQKLPIETKASVPTPTITAEEKPVSTQERALLLDLRHRNGELDAREVALNARDAVLVAAEKRLTVRIDELGALQKRLEALEANRKARDDTNWQGLVKMYEQMRPRDAAGIFNDLDRAVLLQVLDRMKEVRAAPILAAMQPERARQLTADIAQMRVRDNQAPGTATAASPTLTKANMQTQGTK